MMITYLIHTCDETSFLFFINKENEKVQIFNRNREQIIELTTFGSDLSDADTYRGYSTIGHLRLYCRIAASRLRRRMENSRRASQRRARPTTKSRPKSCTLGCKL